MRDYIQARHNPDAVFLDIGACEGQHSLFMSQYVKNIHAFEPFPPAIKRFRNIVAINNFSHINIHEVGLGAKESLDRFYAPPKDNIGSGTFLPAHAQGDKASIGTFRVVAGDRWLESLNASSSVELVKIDVEGSEESVLRGLSMTLKKNRPALVIELSQPPHGTIESPDELKELLPDHYGLLRFIDSRERAITGNYRLEDFRSFSGSYYDMILAYPKEREDTIKRGRSR
jgi:FkbM family methyltransferase